MEHSETVVAENVPKELVQRKSYPEFEERFRDSYVTPRGLVHSALLAGHLYLQLIACRQLAGILNGDRQNVIRTAHLYVT